MNYPLLESFFLYWIVPQLMVGMVLCFFSSSRQALAGFLLKLKSGIMGRIERWSLLVLFVFPVAAWALPVLKPMEAWVFLGVFQLGVMPILRWVSVADEVPTNKGLVS